jgi:hypothetical protein
MRITVRIDDEIFRGVLEHATRSGRTVGEVIEDALRQSLQSSGPGESPSLPTFGGSGVLPDVDPGSNAALLETMDQPSSSDALP